MQLLQWCHIQLKQPIPFIIYFLLRSLVSCQSGRQFSTNIPSNLIISSNSQQANRQLCQCFFFFSSARITAVSARCIRMGLLTNLSQALETCEYTFLVLIGLLSTTGVRPISAGVVLHNSTCQHNSEWKYYIGKLILPQIHS